MEIARKDLRILFEGEALDDYCALKIAELVRGSSGAFALREEYGPPCLFISSSPRLMAFLRRMLEILSNKTEELSS